MCYIRVMNTKSTLTQEQQVAEEAMYERLIAQGFWLLRFPSELESRFQQYYLQLYLRVMRRALLIGGVIFFLCTMLVDILAGYDVLAAQQIRWGLIAPLFCGALLVLYHPSMRRYYELAVMLGAFFVGLGCIFIGVTQEPLMGILYINGLMVVAMFVFSASRVRFWHAFSCCVSLAIICGAALFWAGYFDTAFILTYVWVYCAGVGLMAFSAYAFEAHERTKFLQAQIASIERKRLLDVNQELLSLANLDPLTGVANKRYFERYLSTEWRRALRHRACLGLLIIDVDSFKDYNDAQGHLAGDKCLKAVAEALKENVFRPYDIVARYGGDEFVVLLTDASFEGAMKVADSISNAVRAIDYKSFSAQPVTVSIGLTSIRASVEFSYEQLIQQADKALYQAKDSGRDCVRAYGATTLEKKSA